MEEKNKRILKKILVIACIILVLILIVLVSILLYRYIKNRISSKVPPASTPPDSNGPPSSNAPSNGPPSYSPSPNAPPSYAPSPNAPSSDYGIWYAAGTQPNGDQAIFDTYADASQYCQNYGSQVATINELDEAFSANWHNYCNVGWVQDSNATPPEKVGYISGSGVNQCLNTDKLGYNNYVKNPVRQGALQGVYCTGSIPSYMASDTPYTVCTKGSLNTATNETRCYYQQS